MLRAGEVNDDDDDDGKDDDDEKVKHVWSALRLWLPILTKTHTI